MPNLLNLCKDLPTRTFKEGDALLEEDDKDGEILILKTGKVEVLRHETQVTTIVNPGAVFGEIGGRPPGAHLVDLINYASDIDTYTGWAEAVVHGRYSQRGERKYNAAWIFKRARGQGVVQGYEGLEALMSEIGDHVVAIDLTPIGSPRRDWKNTLVGDGLVIVRHPDLQTTIDLAGKVASRFQVIAS